MSRRIRFDDSMEAQGYWAIKQYQSAISELDNYIRTIGK
jgi:hypothetical protein